MESRKTIELCRKLYKPEKEQKIFLGFRILKNKNRRKQKTEQNLFGFLNVKPKLEGEASQY
jgi:hypothetical protein